MTRCALISPENRLNNNASILLSKEYKELEDPPNWEPFEKINPVDTFFKRNCLYGVS